MQDTYGEADKPGARWVPCACGETPGGLPIAWKKPASVRVFRSARVKAGASR